MSMEEFIPPGFVPLANWDSRNRRHNDGHSVAWKTLSDAVKNAEIPGFKLSNGRWYVHEQVSNEHLAKVLPPATECAVSAEADVSIYKLYGRSACESLKEISSDVATLRQILLVLERLTAAVESVATQPKTETVGTWRDMNGESL